MALGSATVTERCLVCDGAYCGQGRCSGREGYVWVRGQGWRTEQAAADAESSGAYVDWADVWTSERFGLT